MKGRLSQDDDMTSRERFKDALLPALKMRKLKNARSAILENGKGKETDSPQSLQREKTTANTLTLCK